jgi:predicted tellurium resistance membrane protein TerC
MTIPRRGEIQGPGAESQGLDATDRRRRALACADRVTGKAVTVYESVRTASLFKIGFSPMIELLANPEVWISFITLAVLEIVLGVDNIVFIAILAGKLPPEQRDKARQIGLAVALITRLLLLFSLYWISHIESTLFMLPLPGGDFAVTWRSIILGGGGMYLIYKAIVEMNETIRHAPHMENDLENADKPGKKRAVFGWIILQIAIIDIVFSLDSVITAVGMADHVEVMAAAIILAVFVMLFLINPISRFIDKHKEVKIVALSFLLLVGFILVAEAGGVHVPKAYLYFALGFSSFIQIMVLWSQSSEAKLVEKQTAKD